MRVFLPSASKVLDGKRAQPEIARFERRMLPGQDKAWCEPAFGERPCDRRQFDGFRPGPDDQPDICKRQCSP